MAAEMKSLLEPLLAAFDQLLSVGELVCITVPTNVGHAHRRARELAAAVEVLRALGIEPRTAEAASETIERIAGADLSALEASASRTLERTICALVHARALMTPA